MPSNRRRPNWQLPDGVSTGTWDYSQSDSIADDYDDYFHGHGMFRLDEEVTSRHFKPGRWVIDLGCGTGRALPHLIANGSKGVAFDLSQKMLATVREKQELRHSVCCVRGNLVDLDCFRDESFDYAVCLFSTLGMIRGNLARHEAVRHTSRILKPDGLLVLQVHNYWVHLFDPEGPLWMLRNLTRAKLKRDVELGDRFFLYRGIPDMYLHSFTRRELTSLLSRNQLKIIELIPLNARQNSRLSADWLLPYIRASGWIVVAQKTA